MDRNDILNLRNDCLYEFTSYQGIKHYGILTEGADEIHYIIPTPNIKKWNVEVRGRNPVAHQTLGIKINPECISDWEEYYPDSVFRVNTNDTVTFDSSKANKLIILGAGASMDFLSSNKKDKPPLANELFNERYEHIFKHYSGVKSRLSSLRRAKDIEIFFQSEWDYLTNHYDPVGLKNIISLQYYLHHLMNSITIECDNFDNNNYDSLITSAYRFAIRNKRKVLITSFNYDTLLERSLERSSKIEFNSLDDYIFNNSNLLYYKIHGSCNWGLPINAYLSNSGVNSIPEMANWIDKNVKNLADLKYKMIRNQDNIQVIKNPAIHDGQLHNAVIHHEQKDYSYYPALFLPFKEKDDFVLPTKHHTSLKHYLGDIQDVLIIGWKGEETLFNELLKSRLNSRKINLTVVDPNSGEVWKKMEKVFDISSFTEYKSFSEFIQKEGDEVFFK